MSKRLEQTRSANHSEYEMAFLLLIINIHHAEDELYLFEDVTLFGDSN